MYMYKRVCVYIYIYTHTHIFPDPTKKRRGFHQPPVHPLGEGHGVQGLLNHTNNILIIVIISMITTPIVNI